MISPSATDFRHWVARLKLFVLLGALCPGVVFAFNCVSKVTGNWGDATTWNNCNGTVPQDGDSVIILNTHNVTLNVTTQTLASLTLNSGGTITGASGKDIFLGGNLVNNGTLNVAAGSSTNTIYLVGDAVTSSLTSTWSGTGTWNLDNVDLNGSGSNKCTGSCKLEVTGTPTLSFANSGIFAGNSSPTRVFNSNGNAAFTVNLNRAGNQNVQTNGVTFPNLILSGSGNKSPSSGTFNVLGNLTVSSGVTVDLTAHDPVTNIGGSLSNAGTLTASNNAARLLTISGDLVNSGTYTGNSSSVNLAGNFDNTGTFTSGSGVWTLNGGSPKSLLHGAPSFQNLVMNGAGFTLSSGSLTVTTLLTLTSGNITTGANAVIAAANCPGSISRTGGHVDGNLRLTFPAASTTCTFHVGSGAYAPIVITNTGAGTLTGSTIGADLPPSGTSGINQIGRAHV